MSPIQKFYVASSSPYKAYNQTFTSSGTWTCPVGTTEVEVFAVGGGGGSGGLDFSASTQYGVTGGGGGGSIHKKTVSVVPGTTYSITVGAGGAGGNGSLTGQMGGFSRFNNSYTLLNGILQQPYPDTNYFRYYSGSSFSLSSPPAYTNNSFSSNTPNYFFSNSTPGVNTAVSQGGYTRAVYLGGSSSQSTYFWVAVKPSTSYAASGYFAVNSSSNTANIRIDWYTGLYGSFISAVDGTQTTVPTTWTRLSAIGTSPSNANYALIRFQGSGSNQLYLSGAQFEEGSSVTSFKSPGFNAPAGSRVVQNLGLISESSDTLIVGGGGGGQTISTQNSNSWYNSSYVVRPEYSGAGGGTAYYNSASFPMVGGNGESYNGSVGQHPTLHISNYTNTSAELQYITNYITYEGVGTGGNAYYPSGASAGYFHIGILPDAYEGFYGAGGVGGRYSSVSQSGIAPGSGAVDGRGAMANSGGGASGFQNAGTTAATRNMVGGTGGSGIVQLKWMGQA